MINLGAAAVFAVLAHDSITNTGATTLCGDLGLSTGSSVGGGYVLNCGGVTHVTDAAAVDAEAALTIAYNDAVGRTSTASYDGELGNQTFNPGIYRSSTSLGLTGSVTLDAKGDPNAVFIFQIGSTLTTATGSSVILTGSAKATNVFWLVGTSCTLGTNSTFNGNILAKASITVNNGTVLIGRALAMVSVTLDTNSITKPAP
jgi:hypothetical protein